MNKTNYKENNREKRTVITLFAWIPGYLGFMSEKNSYNNSFVLFTG